LSLAGAMWNTLRPPRSCGKPPTDAGAVRSGESESVRTEPSFRQTLRRQRANAAAALRVALWACCVAPCALAPQEMRAPTAEAQDASARRQRRDAAVAADAVAQTSNPFDAEVRRLEAEVVRQARTPRALLSLLDLWRKWETASPGVVDGALARLARDRRLSPNVRVYAGALAAQAKVRRGDVAGAAADARALGYLMRWRVIGPFDNEGKRGFDRDTPPEAERSAATDPSAVYPGRERPVTWRAYPDVSLLGYVNFDAIFRPFENTCGLAETYVQIDRARPLTLWAGAGGAIKVYWNGEEVVRDPAYRAPDPDRVAAVVRARAGWNRVLVKNCTADRAWGFFLRVAEVDGTPLRVAPTTDATRTEAVAPAPASGTPRAPEPPLTTLERAASAATPTAEALEDLARFLAWTGADDPSERRAKDLARRAADAAPTVQRLRLAAALADERAEVQRFAARAAQVAADDPDSLLLQAQSVAGGPVPEDALPLLDRIRPGTTAWVEGELLRANILRGLGLHAAARRATERAVAPLGDAAMALRARADALAATSRADEALQLRRRLVAVRYDDQAARRALVSDALQRGDADEAIAHVEALLAIAPDSSRQMGYAAAVFDGLGRDDDVVAMWRRAIDLAPEDASAHVSLGRALLRLGRRDAAADSLRRALALRPQDASTRELLENLRPEPRRDESFAATKEDLLGRRVEAGRYPVTILQNLKVTTVYENGLSSRFHQVAAQIHDQEGARRWRTYSLQFDPESQRVEVRLARVHRADGRTLDSNQQFEQPLGEPWYRIYYDTRALVVVFPDLEPGDVVELRYRIDDVSHRNAFADYFGDLHFLQSTDPVRRIEYVLITPASRTFHFNEPRMERLVRSRRREGNENVDRFVATDVPPVQPEDGMPGWTEVAPYLHISTYRTWEEVGRWWWGLVKDQLQTDERLRQTVRDLVRGAPDTRTKVARIYDWVVTNTRYVGLEFGIHGFKPYRVPQVVQRGFGDCKDKASLLYVMMREAGIDARIALTRTRRNGAITDLPASLSVFDHAIAYVPELDLFLDGTAEHAGSTELPPMDQGVTVLLVGPEDARLTRTPVHEPARNRRERILEADLAADGSALIRGTEVVRGTDAASYRDRYQAEGTRSNRYERALASLFPGVELQDVVFRTGLRDREQPIALEWRARVPHFAPRDGTALRLPPSVIEDLVRSLARTPTRRYPLDLGSTSSYVEERRVRLPTGARVTDLPPGGEARSEFGHLMLRVEQAGNVVRTRMEFELSRDRIPPDEYAAFRQWVERADAIARQRITVTTAVTGGGKQ
jgi:tetratricopeptide (TPR) repeat protein